MKDYHDLFLKCDVLLLADAFEKFRNNSLTNYGLFPSHYLSVSWDAIVNMTKVDLELISDADMYLLFEKANNKNSKPFFAFLSGFSITTIRETQDCRGRGEGISLTPHCHFHPFNRHLDISRAITAESSPLHIASTRTRTGNLWFPRASR